jgi:hypothetical protein
VTIETEMRRFCESSGGEEQKHMTRYVFIESADPFASGDTHFVAAQAVALKQRGKEVVVFLVQNGVLAARQNAGGSLLSLLTRAGVCLLADDFSLRERGIRAEEVRAGVSPSPIESLVDILVQENTKALWH